jgi:hypothetical protein
MAKRYWVTLTAQERGELERMIARGKADARKLAHARVLLQADEAEGGGPGWTDEAIAAAVRVSVRTVERVRERAACPPAAGGRPGGRARACGGAAAQAVPAALWAQA